MATPAGRSATVSSATSLGGSYTALSSMKLASFSLGYGTADSSAFGDTGPRALPTVTTFSGTLSGLYNQGDTGQSTVRTAITNRTTTFLQILLDGTNGWKCECAVTQSFNVSQSGAVEYTINFECAGGAAPSAVSSP